MARFKPFGAGTRTIDGELSRRAHLEARRAQTGCGTIGCLGLIVLGLLMKAAEAAANNPYEAVALTVALAGISVGALFIVNWHKNKQKDEADAKSEDERAAWDEHNRQRFASLASRFDEATADAIMRQRIWQGQTTEMLVEALGHPSDVTEKVLKTKTWHTYKYHPIAANRYGLHVSLENGVVVGWEEKG